MAKIFVSIASYRDPELLPTLKNLLENARNPDDLVICIAWQHSKEDKWDTLKKYKKDPRFKIIDIDYKDSKGVCWARSEIQKLYTDEDYYFQLDSHHRFSKDWDLQLKDILNYLMLKGHEKPLLSTYIPEYFPDKDPKDRLNEIWGLNIDRFMPAGAIFLRPHHIENWQDLKEPFPTRFVSAHFIFTLGKFVDEVPYDPNLYFHGEESSLAARAYTHGYDLFAPHKVIVWHEYTRKGKKRHWDDSQDWKAKDDASYARFRKLFGMDPGCSPCQRKALAPYGFGTVRSLEDFERYAGLKFSTRQIHKETIEYKFPPIKGDYESGLTSTFKHCIDVYRGSLTETDYDYFAVAFLNENGEDVYRRDCDKAEINSMLSADPNNKFIHIWRDFEAVERPISWRVWPHSESKGWMERIEQKIQYE
jgi:glycosyltransferase involved in cell wall biosynthesis